MFMTLLLLIALSLCLSLAFTPIVRKIALRWGLVDQPDHKRKVHQKPIPRVGGVAVAAAYFGSCLLVCAILSQHQFGDAPGFGATKAIAPAVMLIFLVGLADDILNLQPWHKFAVQALASVMVVSQGFHIQTISAFNVHPALGTVVTVVWLVACTNAVNLIDGLDGLASGVALLATVTTLVAAMISGNTELMVAAAPLAGALLGFLVFNFNPASIFLGDSGSLVLGFLLGCYSILWTGKSSTVLGMMAPVMALSIPLLDTTLAITRRFLCGQPLFRPDKSHIHHRLLARGLTVRRAVVLLYLASGLAGALSLCLIVARNHWEAVVICLFVCGVIYGIRQLSYAEFQTLRRIVLDGGLKREINAQIAVRTLEAKLAQAGSADACWVIVQEAAGDFGILPIRMRLGGQTFGYRAGQSLGQPWAMRITISNDEWIDLSHDMRPTGHPTALVSLATMIRTALAGKGNVAGPVEEQAALFSTTLYATVASTAQWSSEQAF